MKKAFHDQDPDPVEEIRSIRLDLYREFRTARALGDYLRGCAKSDKRGTCRKETVLAVRR